MAARWFDADLDDLPQPGEPSMDLLITTWGPDGPETRDSKCRRRLPVLGRPDPNPMPRIHFLRRSRRRAT